MKPVLDENSMSLPDDQELTIEFAEPLPVHVNEGLHDATVVRIKQTELTRWKRNCLVFTFKIQELGPAHHVILPGFINLGSSARQQKTKPSSSSKLARWWRIIADYTGGSRKRVALGEFKQFLFQVHVANVEHDNRERPIPVSGQGQVVAEIVSIVQKLGTGQQTTTTPGYPAFIPSLGPLRSDAVDRCERCDELTPFAYGCRRFCRLHAQQQARGAE